MIARVPNEPLRDAFLNSNLSAIEVCKRLEWWRPRKAHGKHRARQTLNTNRLVRSLGLKPNYYQTGERFLAVSLSAVDAERLCDVLGVDFAVLYPEPQVPAGWCACGEPLYIVAEACGFCSLGVAA